MEPVAGEGQTTVLFEKKSIFKYGTKHHALPDSYATDYHVYGY